MLDNLTGEKKSFFVVEKDPVTFKESKEMISTNLTKRG
jgi:hypothetical protein